MPNAEIHKARGTWEYETVAGEPREVPAYEPRPGYSVDDAVKALGGRCLSRSEERQARSDGTAIAAVIEDGRDHPVVP